MLCVLGLLGVLTSCSKSFSWSYCFSIILLIIFIFQCLAGALVIFFWSVAKFFDCFVKHCCVRNQIERLFEESLLQTMK